MLTAYGIETFSHGEYLLQYESCDSTYRLWYCNGTALNPLKSVRYTKFTRAARGIESHTLITYEKDPSESL